MALYYDITFAQHFKKEADKRKRSDLPIEITNPPHLTRKRIMGVLKSELFTDADSATVTKLENCAVGRPNEVISHFDMGANGEHVTRVQQALENIQEREPALGIPKFKVNGVYDDVFANAVFVYKEKRGILNFANKIDKVIGIKTIRRLDKDQFFEPLVEETQDIVGAVANQGEEIEDGSGQLAVGVLPIADFNKQIETEEYMRFHRKLKHFQWRGGQTPNDPSEKIANQIASNHDPKGFVLVVGLSSGGPNVLAVGQALQAKGIKLAYAGICDGAFPNSNPQLRTAVFSPLKGENFFQTLGPDIAPEQEFHGAIIGGGFVNTDFSNFADFKEAKIKLEIALKQTPFFQGRLKQAFINQVHLMAVREGYRLAKASMESLLRS